MVIEPKKQSLEEFFSSDTRNAWCRDKTIRVYLVKSARVGELILGNITNLGRSTNMFKQETYKVTGQFRPFMDKLEHLASEYGYRTLRVECIVNEFLPDVLKRRGYVSDNHSGLIISDCYLQLPVIEGVPIAVHPLMRYVETVNHGEVNA